MVHSRISSGQSVRVPQPLCLYLPPHHVNGNHDNSNHDNSNHDKNNHDNSLIDDDNRFQNLARERWGAPITTAITAITSNDIMSREPC